MFNTRVNKKTVLTFTYKADKAKRSNCQYSEKGKSFFSF